MDGSIGRQNKIIKEKCSICSEGILCGTIAGKKKKKMMYLTAKNAGLSSKKRVNKYKYKR